jgi:hypothetical protein
VSDLFFSQCLRNNPDDLASIAEHGVRDRTHQAHAPAAVDEIVAARAELLAKLLGRFDILRLPPRTGACKNTDAFVRCSHARVREQFMYSTL